MMNRRPFSGSCTTCSFSTTVPRLAVSARTIGASATTVTCSRTSPTAEIEIDARLFTRRETDAFAAKGLEARELDIEAVLARSQAGHRVHAIAGGDDHTLQIRPCFGDGDRRAGNGGPGLIFHKASDFAGSRLRTGGHHRGAAHTCDGQTD